MALRTFKPGLFGIGLKFEDRLSNHYLKVKCKKLTYNHKRKPIYILPAIYNLEALLLFHMDLGKMKACLFLEKLITEFPKDLNILADLIHVYKKMDREGESDEYRKQLELYKDDTLLQAKSILGQAFAMVHDFTGKHNKPSALLKDTWKQLDMKDKRSGQTNNASNLLVKTYKVVNAIPEAPYETEIDLLESAVEKFETGIKILENSNCSQEEISIWEWQLAFSRSRLDNFREVIGDDGSRRLENCIRGLEAYLNVIKNLYPHEDLDEPLKYYVAKSYIYYTNLYLSCTLCIDPGQLPEKIRNQNLDFMCNQAKMIFPESSKISQKCGLYRSQRKEYFKAIELFNESINLNPDIDINWGSYSNRSLAYFYSTEISDKDQSMEYLELAYNDMKLCLQSTYTESSKIGFSMMFMALLCFLRAMPSEESCIRFHCQNKSLIYEALEILNEALNKWCITKEFRIYSSFGRYYPYIGKYRKAIESLKTALELNAWSQKFPWVFLNLCKCFFAFYEKEQDKNLLSEFRFMLKEAKKRGCDEWVTEAIDTMCQHEPEMLTDLVQNMIEWDVRGCEKLIEEVLNKTSIQNPTESYRDLEREFKRKLQERNDPESIINGPVEILKSQRAEITEQFKYDFFVSHGAKDKDWVNSMLLPRLEEFCDEIKFKGFIPSRDFVPGKKIIDSMLEGITQSRKLLMVLTPNYIEDNYQKYFCDIMLISAIETKLKEKTIVPIILEECEIPLKIAPFTPIYFTQNSDWERLRRSLTINMDSETLLEERMSALTTCNIGTD